MAELYAIFTGPMEAYAMDRMNELDVLDEAVLRTGLAQLGVDLDAADDEGFWGLDTLVYDVNLERGSDGRCRALAGEMHYDKVVAEADARTVFRDLYELARSLNAQLWQPGGGGAPLLMTPDVLEDHIRAAAD